MVNFTATHSRKKLTLICAMLTLLSAGFLATVSAQAANDSTASNPAADARAALQQLHAALHAGNGEAVLALLSDNVRIYESGHAETRAQYAAHHLAADMAFAKATTSTSSNTVVDCENTLCVIHQQSETRGSYKGKVIDSKGTETAVLRLSPQGWRISHLHWSNQ